MALSSWIPNWKRSLDRRWALYQTLRRTALARRLATRLRLEVLEDRTALSTYTVTTTADNGNNTTPTAGSLRWAIEQANTGTGNEIDFNIPGTDVQTIYPPNALPAISANDTFVNGSSENQYQHSASTLPLIELNGSSLPSGSNINGLELSGTNCTVSGLMIDNFTGNGIQFDANATDNLIGSTAAGGANVILSNTGDGILIETNADNNTIGGTATGAGNVISGNTGSGVEIAGTGELVQGNYIGTDVTGNHVLANGNGIFIRNSSNKIGGTSVGARNVISGNDGGAIGITTVISGVLIQGNYIGTDVTGSVALPNDSNLKSAPNGAINISGPGNTIGGTATGAGNLISGNDNYAVVLHNAVNGTLIQGNYIGTDVTGTTAIGNSGGIDIIGAADNTIGGTVSADRNIISGNSNDGVLFESDAGSNQVLGNYIGTDVTGTKALANSTGIKLDSGGNIVGGTASGTLNVISGNSNDGVLLEVSGNSVLGNYIGTDVTGTKAVANSVGVEVSGTGITLDSTVSGSRNIISGNSSYGVKIDGSASGGQVQGNYIGTDVTGSSAVPNGTGIDVEGGSNTIGGTTSATRNVISGNSNDGVLIHTGNQGASGNQVQGNYIGINAAGNGALGNSKGIEVNGNHNSIGGTVSGSFNIISGNSNDGVLIDSAATGNQVQGNRIGLNVSGNGAIANNNGIEVAGNSNTLGTSYGVSSNVISGNINDGVLIDSGASANQVMGNYIGTNSAGTSVVANSVGIKDEGSSNTLGGSTLGARNVISGNTGDGVLIDASATKETMQDNSIGLNGDENAAIANGTNGVEVAGTNNTIGGNSGSNYYVRNFIGRNGNDGVLIDSGASGNQVQGNFVGVDVSGTIGVGNAANAVEIAGSSNTIGGTSSGYSNTLSGSGNDGIRVDSTATGNAVQGNYVGTDYTGTHPIANSGNGVEIAGSSNAIGGSVSGAGNTIAYNSSGGVLVSAGSGNTIRQNSIFANGNSQTGPGITLDSGANDNLGPPTLNSATLSGSTLTVMGSFTATTTNPYVLEFFANPTGDPEGKIYLGSLTVTPSTTGTQSFTFTATTSVTGSNPLITATLTDSTGDTSAFSPDVTVS